MPELQVFETRFETNEKYSEALTIINTVLPEVTRATELFNKTQSNFMDDMLTVSHVTPIRNLRQILSEMKKTRMALGEAYYNIKKKQIEIEEKKIEVCNEFGLQRDKVELEIEEIEWHIACIQENVGGAIRKLANYSKQYQSIVDQHNLSGFTESDFEAEEEQYHICKAFEQGLNAARAHGGYIDEGNQIYFSQIGINGTAAQVEVANYLQSEARAVNEGVELTHDMQLEFFLRMAEKFKGCSSHYAEWKGQLAPSLP